MLKLSAALIIFFLCITLTAPVMAQQQQVLTKAAQAEISEVLQKTPPIRFLPNNPLHAFITLKENAQRFFQSSSVKRAKFDLTLSGKRLKEAYLLSEKKGPKEAAKSLEKYSKRLDKMVKTLDLARSQNQEVLPLVEELAEGLKQQEILLSAISETPNRDKYPAFQVNFQKSLNSFAGAVVYFNSIKPGIKDRFVIVGINESQKKVSPSPSPSSNPAATSSSQPRKIIY